MADLDVGSDRAQEEPDGCAAYLPPVWGWATLAWMRRREYV